MRNRRAILTAALLLIWTSGVAARQSCTVITLKDDFKRASVVFLGEAYSTQQGQFRVIKVWKGSLPPAIGLETAEYQSSFKSGVRYLVFGYEHPNGVLYLHDCSHTKPVIAAFVEKEISTIEKRHRWWKSPLSSLSWRHRPGKP